MADNAETPETATAPEPPRRKVGFVRRWTRRLFVVAVLVIGLAAALPWILTHTAVGDAALAEVSRRLPPGATVGGLSLSWINPVGVYDVAFDNGKGVDVTVKEIVTEQSMLWMLLNRTAPESFTLNDVTATVDLEALPAESGDEPGDETIQEPRNMTVPAVKLVNATVQIVNGPFRKPVVTRIDELAMTPTDTDMLSIVGEGQIFAADLGAGSPFRVTGDLDPQGKIGRCGISMQQVDCDEVLQILQVPPFLATGLLDVQTLISRESVDQPWQAKTSVQSPRLSVQAIGENARRVQINDLTVSAAGQYAPDTREFLVAPFALESDLTRGAWSIRGTASEQLQATLDGRLELLGPAVALANLPDEVQLSSVRFDPLIMKLRDDAVELSGSIQWPSCIAFGLRSDDGQVNYQLTPSMLDVSLANVPVGSGRAVGEYRFDLAATPPRLEFAGGPVLQRIALTEQLCRDWLKYVSPTLANATDVRGEFGLSLNPINTPLAAGQLTGVGGQLLIAEGSLQPGPLGRDIIESIGSIGALAGSDSIRSRIGESNNLELMRLPNQQVDFVVQGNTVHHRGFTLVSGNVALQTAGMVNVDNQLDVIARLTLDAESVRNKPILAGAFSRPVDIPVGGTIDSPKIDRSAFKNFGRDAAAGAIGGLLQKLLDRKK